MDTNNSDQNKWIKNVEILYSDNFEYGPRHNFTRRQWRAICLEKLNSGKEEFESWQRLILGEGINNTHISSFGIVITYEDGSKEKVARWCESFVLDFAGHKFDEGINADNFEFILQASFDGAIIESSSHFSNVIFHKNVGFKHTEFGDGAWFRNSKFIVGAEFKSAFFPVDSFFIGAEFNGWCEFQNANFRSEIIFEGATFNTVGHFEKVKFINNIPNFMGVDNAKTLLVFSEDECFNKDDSSEDAIKRLGQLKRLADEHGQTDQALMFNAFELNAKAKQSKAGLALKLVTWLYKVLSNYGRSFAKPIFWYGVLICLSAILAMAYSTYSESPAEERKVLCKQLDGQPPPLKLPYGRAVVEYAMFRVGGLMDFTDTGKQNNAVNCRLFEEPIEPPLMRAWGIFKGIASIALLFLAALGLRNKYRIK